MPHGVVCWTNSNHPNPLVVRLLRWDRPPRVDCARAPWWTCARRSAGHVRSSSGVSAHLLLRARTLRMPNAPRSVGERMYLFALRHSSHVRGATCRTFRQSVNAHAMSTAPAPAAERPKVLVLAGTTGVGKTAVALELAQMLDGEVVNADSVQARARSRHPPWTSPSQLRSDASAATHLQVYQGLDIGSAKIPESERRGAPSAASSVSPVGTAEPPCVTQRAHWRRALRSQAFHTTCSTCCHRATCSTPGTGWTPRGRSPPTSSRCGDPPRPHQAMAIDAGPLARTQTVAFRRTRATAVIGVPHNTRRQLRVRRRCVA